MKKEEKEAVKVLEHLKEEYKKIRDKGKEKAEKVDCYVKENPYKAIGIAAGTAAIGGLLIGLLIKKKRE